MVEWKRPLSGHDMENVVFKVNSCFVGNKAANVITHVALKHFPCHCRGPKRVFSEVWNSTRLHIKDRPNNRPIKGLWICSV